MQIKLFKCTFKIDEQFAIEGEEMDFSTNGVLRISKTCLPIGFNSSTDFGGLKMSSSFNLLRFSSGTLSCIGERFRVLLIVGKSK